MRIWIDLENSPHVPFFVPIIRELRARDIEVIITARDFAQTKQLVQDAHLDARTIGKEAGDNTIRKSAALLWRSIRLAIHLRRKQIDLAVGHGSRGLLLASRMLGVPSLILYDYEGANVKLFNKLAKWVMTPDVIPLSMLQALGLDDARSLRYHGLKEEVYIADFTANTEFGTSVGLAAGKIIITVRPPSHTAHYKSDQSFQLFSEIMSRLARRDDIQLVFSPRSGRQTHEIKTSPWFDRESMIVLERAVSGLDLLYHSDLVIGGGGTMNREAAVLAVPVVSIFKGTPGAVDEWLESSGKLRTITEASEIDRFVKKRDRTRQAIVSTKVREEIIAAILRLAGR